MLEREASNAPWLELKNTGREEKKYGKGKSKGSREPAVAEEDRRAKGKGKSRSRREIAWCRTALDVDPWANAKFPAVAEKTRDSDSDDFATTGDRAKFL